MSELSVAKAGGTSNANAESILKSLDWAAQSNVFVVSAPGKISGAEPECDKITNQLLDARRQYVNGGNINKQTTDNITGRYEPIVRDLGLPNMGTWIDQISPRVNDAARHSKDAASMIGEQFMAEIYEALGFKLINPGRSPADLGNDPDAWRDWMQTFFDKSEHYVLPGNTTLHDNKLTTFERGGSDISGGLAAYAIKADINLNLTDGPAMSADPRLVPKDLLRHISHLLYVEGRELGRNGTGLVHPAAMLPLMKGNIPTLVRSTFNSEQEHTIIDNDTVRATRRSGRVAALSLMNNVTMQRVYEPGMAEQPGRLASFENGLADAGVSIIDSQSDGVDGQRYFINTDDAKTAHEALEKASSGVVTVQESVSLVTMVGYNLERRIIDTLFEVLLNGGIDPKRWQSKGHDISTSPHSLRISVDTDVSKDVLKELHHVLIEKH